MKANTNRRKFLKLAALSGAGLGLSNTFSRALAGTPGAGDHPAGVGAAGGMMGRSADSPEAGLPGGRFLPNRAASWWCEINDLLWPEKHVIDKIKRRADGYAGAGIDTAINFGFHNRFDFANYFGQLHGYYANVCEELHQRGIRWMEHYSCNHVTRPRNEEDFRNVHKYERLAVQLFPDPIAARHAQYEGHFFQDLCEVDLRDGSRGYAKQYQYEAFCHNNPGLHDMHSKYLRRLMKDVPFDGIEVDDMCSYPGNTTCGCKYCRDRFRRDYGHEIPDFSDKQFFGDTSNPHMLEWGNYENPVFRDWLRMKSDSVRDHIKMIKETVGERPLMTCCSDTGPIVLNAVALDLEKMAPYLDLFMLENVGTNIKNVEWVGMDAEALNQKDIAAKRGNAPAIALSYELSEKGAYLGWALGRFWGAANWSSTLNGRLEEDPPHAMEMEDVISRWNNWEKKYSDLHYWEGQDLVEVRLVNNRLCRENGWRDASGHEHWDRSKAWSMQLVQHNVGYRFVRSEELADGKALLAGHQPLVLDGVGCVSDRQFEAIREYLAAGGTAWMALPFGTHDEKGFARKKPLSDRLLKGRYKGLVRVESAIVTTAGTETTSLSPVAGVSAGAAARETAVAIGSGGGPLAKLIASGKFKPVLRQLKGDPRWAARIRTYEGGGAVLHFMNAGLMAEPDTLNDLWGTPLMKDIVSLVKDHRLEYEVDTSRVKLEGLSLLSPELEDEKRTVAVSAGKNGHAVVRVNLEGVAIYGVAQR
ncbi:MAG: twin-arginine translocation signal domain-containing protein [Puia sp.]|nr:twin-arginine translocation signal domain-containing protein [Puia sp.]